MPCRSFPDVLRHSITTHVPESKTMKVRVPPSGRLSGGLAFLFCCCLTFSRRSRFRRTECFANGIGFFQPVGDRRLHFVAVLDAQLMSHLDAGRLDDLPDPRVLDRPAEEEPDFEKRFLGAHKEVTHLARKHDRVVRRVNPLVAELRCCIAKPLPRIYQIFGQAARKRGFRRRPAIVGRPRFDLLLAVKAGSCFQSSDRAAQTSPALYKASSLLQARSASALS
jgi:hypothetical protein